MNAPALSARVASRRLTGTFDAQSLFARLRRQTGSGEEMFFERTGGVALIVTNALLRIRCDRQRVKVTGLHEGSACLLEALRHRLAPHIVERGENELLCEFPRCENPDEEVRLLAENPFTVLRTIRSILRDSDDHEPFGVTLLGAVGFDHVDMFEALPERPPAAGSFPDFEFRLADGLVVVDPVGGARVLAMAIADGDAGATHHRLSVSHERLADIGRRCLQTIGDHPEETVCHAAEPVPDLSDSDFETIVRELKAHIAAGDIFQAVPSRTFNAVCGDALAAFDRLRQADPSAYRFFLSGSWGELFGASPETAVRLTRYDHSLRIKVSPMAGTRPRGCSADQDDRMRAELMLDGKEIAEHMMLVDLARNDVARISRPGTRRVPSLMEVRSFASVMHLVSTVEGTLAPGLDAFDALRACAVAGTLSGAPKVRAIELVRRYERTARGHYGGAALWINSEGEMDSAIIIRSALVEGGIAHVRAGAGIVHDSVPAAEAAETRAKAAAVLRAIGCAA